MRKTPLTLVQLLLPVLFAATSAAAAPSPALDRLSLWAGGYYPTVDASLIGQVHDADGVRAKAKLSSHDSLLGHFRIDFVAGNSQGFAFDYFRFSNDRSVFIDEAFSFGGVDYAANSELRGEFDMDMGNFAYHWWFGRERSVFGLGLGAAWYQLDLGLSAAAESANGVVYERVGWRDNAIAPLVTLGWRHAATDHVRVYANIDGISKNGGKTTGHIYKGSLGVEVFPWQNAGFALEYSASRVKLRHRDSDFAAGLDMDLRGPSAFLRLRF